MENKEKELGRFGSKQGVIRTSKTISLRLEQKQLDWLDSQDIEKSTYIRRLINKEMEKK